MLKQRGCPVSSALARRLRELDSAGALLRHPGASEDTITALKASLAHHGVPSCRPVDVEVPRERPRVPGK